MDGDQERDKRDELLKLWREYGKTYNVFVPEEQPDPHVWDRELPAPDDKGTLDPQALKHWRYFEKTRDFLRERYADHGILVGPSLIFDCLVPKYQKPMDIPADKRKQYQNTPQGRSTRVVPPGIGDGNYIVGRGWLRLSFRGLPTLEMQTESA